MELQALQLARATQDWGLDHAELTFDSRSPHTRRALRTVRSARVLQLFLQFARSCM